MQTQPTRAGAPCAWTSWIRLVAGVAVATMLFAACSSDTRAAVSDAVAEVGNARARRNFLAGRGLCLWSWPLLRSLA